jgi:hypothetical protein
MKRLALAVLIVVASLFGQHALPASAATCSILLHGQGCPTPSNVRAVASGGQVTVSWSYPGGDATGFHIYRTGIDTNPDSADLATYCSFQTVGTVVSCSWPDPTSVQPGQSYYYKVCAIYSGFNFIGQEDDYDSCALPVTGTIPRSTSPGTGGTSGSSSGTPRTPATQPTNSTRLYQRHSADGSIWEYTGTGTACQADPCPGWIQLDKNPLTADIVAAGGHLYQRWGGGEIWEYTGNHTACGATTYQLLPSPWPLVSPGALSAL